MEEQTPTLETEPDHEDSPTSINGKRPSQVKDGVKIPRKKPKSEHVHLPASDARSNYHKIFEMIFNGCPKSAAAKHFRSICAEDCVFVSRSINNPFGPNYREVRGVSSMVEFVDAYLEAIPDCIFAILDSKFFRKAQNESMIISSYTVNGRMIFTVDTLDTDDVEDIDSAISGLQMLYQGHCGTGNADIDEAAQIICNNVQSAAIKKEEPYPSGKDDSLYSFVYQPTANESAAAEAMIASTRSTHNNSSNSLASSSNHDTKTLSASNGNHAVKALPMDALRLLSHSADSYTSAGGTTSSGVSGANSRDASPFNSNGITLSISTAATAVPALELAPVVPFDYSLKFTSTGASLFEPPTGTSDDEDDEPLESLGINPTMPGSHGGRGGSSVNSGGSSRPSVKELAKIRSNTSTISMLANSSSERIHKRLAHAVTSTTATGVGGSSAASTTSAGAGSVGVSETKRKELNAASLEFWQKQRSNVMIVKEQAKFCLKERVPLGRQIYKVKGTLTLHLNADKKVKRIEMLNSFDVSMHR